MKSPSLILPLSFLLIIAVTLNVATGVQSQTAPCTMDESFKLRKSEYSIPLKCHIGPQFNYFKMTYTVGGYGASVYLLTESQYNAFLEQVKNNPDYVPPKFGDYISYMYMADSGYTGTDGSMTSKTRNDYGTIHVLVKTNPEYRGQYTSVKAQIGITPMRDDSQVIGIAVTTVVSVVVCLCCVGCVSGVVFFVVRRRRKAAYEQVV